MAGVTGLEPAASGVTGRRSNQLSYTPAAFAPRRGCGRPAPPWVSSNQPANPPCFPAPWRVPGARRRGDAAGGLGAFVALLERPAAPPRPGWRSGHRAASRDFNAPALTIKGHEEPRHG